MKGTPGRMNCRDNEHRGGTMRYRHSLAQSAEFLRLAIKHMGQQDAALHPLSYAIWYEYVSGMNLGLQAAIDTRLRNGGKLSDEGTCALYQEHVADLDAESARRIGNTASHLVDDMTESATHAGDQASRFSESLVTWSDKLMGQPAEETWTPAAGVTDMLSDTREMQEAIRTLQERLANSRREAAQLREEVERAREEALLDVLTGLVNRKGFDLAMAACVQQKPTSGPGPCLLMLDLDCFKQINDSHGHLFGDKVLAGIGQVLKANVKGKDTAARYGGEEFAILLPETPRGGAMGLAEALRAMIAGSRIKKNGKNEVMIGNITISIGVADYVAGESGMDFLNRADRALYAAKAQGRNRVVLAPQPRPAPGK